MTLLLSLLALAAHFALPADWRALCGRVADAWLALCAQLPESLNAGIRLALGMIVPMVVLAILLQALREVGLSLLVFVPSAIVLLVIFADSTQPAAVQRFVEQWHQRPWGVPAVQGQPAHEQGDWVSTDVQLEGELATARATLLRESLHELFSPLFWFLLATPVAALGYYLLRLTALEGKDDTRQLAQHWLELADWVPTRLLALSFALAGNFTATWHVIRGRLLRTDAEGHALIDEAAAAAEPAELNPAQAPVDALKEALQGLQGLMQRTLVVWMVMLALHTLWPGA